MEIFVDYNMMKFCDNVEALIKPLKLKVITWTWAFLEQKFCEMVSRKNLGAPRSAVPEILIETPVGVRWHWNYEFPQKRKH